MNKKRKSVINGNKVSEIAELTLNGHVQKVLIEGKEATLPLVVCLHGGPGSPMPFSAGSRGMFPEYTQRFIMVYWDQLGCGVNNCRVNEYFTVNDFVNMSIDLVRGLKKRFPHNKLYLFGASWGSALAAETAKGVPELVDRVIIYGQIIKNMFFNDEVFRALMTSEMSDKHKRQAEKIWRMPIKTKKELTLVVEWMLKYTEGYQSKTGDRMKIGWLLHGNLTSPDYRLKDFLGIFINGYRKNQSIYSGLLGIDLIDTLTHMGVPYHILQGEKDLVTPTHSIQDLIERCGNANLSMRVIPDCGHSPGKECMDVIQEELLKLAE